MKAELAECGNTYFDSSPIYGVGGYYHSTYHTSGSTDACGGDTLFSGEVTVRRLGMFSTRVQVNIQR